MLLAFARRLLLGQRTYGLLSLATDGRNWLRERSQELEDALVYTAIAEVSFCSYFCLRAAPPEPTAPVADVPGLEVAAPVAPPEAPR